MTRWVVLGGSGFVGSAVVSAARRHGADVVAIPAPRLSTGARTVPELLADGDGRDGVVRDLRARMAGFGVVVNAAGAAAPDAGASDRLFGANSLLPLLAARAATLAGARRFVHVSSQSVLGDVETLTEDPVWHPFSPYSRSKALGEMAIVQASDVDNAVCVRALSVQGVGRRTTRRLVGYARGPLPMISVDGPTPLTLIENAAAAVVFCGAFDGPVPTIVLQRDDGLRTREALTLLGARRVWSVPAVLARPALAALRGLGLLDERFLGAARRAELLLFGQRADARWMDANGFVPAAGKPAWAALGDAATRAGPA